MNMNYWNHVETIAVVDGIQWIFPKNILSLFDFLNLWPVEPHEVNSTLTFAEIGANRYRIHGRNSQTKWSRCIVGFTILNISPYFTDFTVKGSSGIPFRRNYRWNMWNQWTFWGRQHDWPDYWTHTSWKSQADAFGDPLIFCPWVWLQPLRKQALMPFAARRCKPLRNCLASNVHLLAIAPYQRVPGLGRECVIFWVSAWTKKIKKNRHTKLQHGPRDLRGFVNDNVCDCPGTCADEENWDCDTCVCPDVCGIRNRDCFCVVFLVILFCQRSTFDWWVMGVNFDIFWCNLHM